jgi:hypothetical protein
MPRGMKIVGVRGNTGGLQIRSNHRGRVVFPPGSRAGSGSGLQPREHRPQVAGLRLRWGRPRSSSGRSQRRLRQEPVTRHRRLLGFVPDPITHDSRNPVRHVLAIGQPGQPHHLDPQGARACCKVGPDRPLSPTAFVANLCRSAVVFSPRRSPDRGSPVTHRRPGRRKGSLLNGASLTP